MISYTLASKIVFILGIINGVSLLALFSSCRCIAMLGPMHKLTTNKRFMKFYKYHCYIWIVLWLSVLTHLTIAITSLGVPF